MNNLLLVCVKPPKEATKNKRVMFNPSVVNSQVKRIRDWCDANIYVFTNYDSSEFDNGINVVDVPEEPQWSSWWSKIFMYANSPKGLNVYVDLDSEFYDNGNIFWELGTTDKPVLWFLKHWDYYDKEYKNPRINGSVIRWTDNELSFVYDLYLNNWENIKRDYFCGDDHFLTCVLDKKDYNVWPEDLIHSFPEIIRANRKIKNVGGLERLGDFPSDMLDGEDYKSKGYKIFTYPSNVKPLLLMKKFPSINEYWGNVL